MMPGLLGFNGTVGGYAAPYGQFTTAPTHGWGLRLLRSAYSGNCIRVRRASDSTQQDIGFDADGNLDVASMESFCSGTDGFITTMYNQVGSGDLVQATASLQPKIVSSGTTITKGTNSKPAAQCGSAIMVALTLDIDTGAKRWGVSALFDTGTITGSPGGDVARAKSSQDGLATGYISSNYHMYAYAAGSAGTGLSAHGISTLNTFTACRTANGGANCAGYVNGSSVGTTTTSASAGGSASFIYGQNTNPATIHIFECFVWVGNDPGVSTIHSQHDGNASAYWGY